MTCAGFEERIARYVGGDLAPEEAVMVEQHLRTCVDCAELARGLEEDRAWLASRPPETADVDFAAMRREIQKEIVGPRRGWKWLAAAVLLAVAVATTLRPPAHRSLARQSASTVTAQKADMPRGTIQSGGRQEAAASVASGSGPEGSMLKRPLPNRSLAVAAQKETVTAQNEKVTAQNAVLPRSSIPSRDRTRALASKGAVPSSQPKPPVLAPEPDSQVAIQLATNDPSVTIILLHESKGVSQ